MRNQLEYKQPVNGRYDIMYGDVTVAWAQKTKDGFEAYILYTSPAQRVLARTMKRLKELLEVDAEDMLTRLDGMTVAEYMKKQRDLVVKGSPLTASTRGRVAPWG